MISTKQLADGLVASMARAAALTLAVDVVGEGEEGKPDSVAVGLIEGKLPRLVPELVFSESNLQEVTGELILDPLKCFTCGSLIHDSPPSGADSGTHPNVVPLD